MGKRVCCLTLDLEPDCGGRFESYDSLVNLERVIDLFTTEQLPLTAFISTQILDLHPEAARALEAIQDLEIGVHAYSHRLGLEDRSEEIRKGIDAYERYYGRPPRGYRAPQGRITAEDLLLLKELGVQYDSSIIPTRIPTRFDHSRFPNRPFVHSASGLSEVPITVLEPFPLPLALGYCRLLGYRGTRAMLTLAKQPEVAVMYFHLHDVELSARAGELRGLWKWFYHRNVAVGTAILTGVIAHFRRAGYEFRCANEVAVCEELPVPARDA